MPKKTNHSTTVQDYIIAFAVFAQPVLSLLQHLLIDGFYMPASETTAYRVTLTAIPMLLAIVISAMRRPLLFVASYAVAFVLLLLTVILYPENEPYLRAESMRFLLPVVIPSALCLMSVKHFDIVERALFIMATVATVEILIYVYYIFAGRIHIDNYNMSISYACLMPMLVLYSQKKLISVFISIIIWFAVLAIGSRGAAFIFLLYIAGDQIINTRKSNGKYYILIFLAIAAIALPALGDFLDTLGIKSRTLRLYTDGTIADSAGRDIIYSYFIDQLKNQPWGIGLYGDRIYTDGVYCHNLLLEICLDFGLLFGGIIIIWCIIYLIKFYRHSGREGRNHMWLYLMSFVAPLMFSESYLESSGFFLCVGLMYLLHQRRRRDVKQASLNMGGWANGVQIRNVESHYGRI